jgi:hypothetical protein
MVPPNYIFASSPFLWRAAASIGSALASATFDSACRFLGLDVVPNGILVAIITDFERVVVGPGLPRTHAGVSAGFQHRRIDRRQRKVMVTFHDHRIWRSAITVSYHIAFMLISRIRCYYCCFPRISTSTSSFSGTMGLRTLTSRREKRSFNT